MTKPRFEDATVEDVIVLVLPSESSAQEPDPENRGWRFAVRAEPGGGLAWISEEQVRFPERVNKPTAQRMRNQRGEICMTPTEQVWLAKAMLEIGGEESVRALIATLDHETAERWSVLCAERAIGAKR